MLSRLFSFDTGPAVSPRAWLLWGALVFTVPFLLNYDFILNAFYHFGAPYSDAGLFAHVLWRNDWVIMNPPQRGNYPYLGVHFSPVLVLVSQLSYFLPTHMVEFFAGFMAIIYTSLALGLFQAFYYCVTPRSHWQMAALSALAVGFSFNTLVLQGIWMPHFEYVMPMTIFLFLLHFTLGKSRWAIFFFLLTLSLREDAGLHLTAALGLLAAIRFSERRSFAAVRKEAYYILAACAYSAFAFWAAAAIRHAYGSQESIITYIYTGNPPYAHLSWELLGNRLAIMFKNHIALWSGVLLTLIWAVRTRNLYLAVGFAAYLPWFLLNWTANNPNTGQLYAYYVFPFLLGLCWPLIAALWKYGAPLPGKVLREMLVLQALLVVCGLVVWDHSLRFGPNFYGARWGSYALRQGAENRQLVRDFIGKFDDGAGDLGIVTVDNGAASLIKGQYQGQIVRFLADQKQPPDTLLYMRPYKRFGTAMHILERARKYQLPNHYCLAGATLCLFTNRTEKRLGIFSSYLMQEALPPGQAKGF